MKSSALYTMDKKVGDKFSCWLSLNSSSSSSRLLVQNELVDVASGSILLPKLKLQFQLKCQNNLWTSAWLDICFYLLKYFNSDNSNFAVSSSEFQSGKPFIQFNSWISNLWFNTITVAYVSFGNSKIADSFFIFPFLIPFCSFSLFELHSTSLTLTSISVCSGFQKAFSILLWTLLYVSSCYDLHIRWLNSTFELLIRWFCSKSLYLSS